MTQKRSSKSLTPNTSPFLLVSIFTTGFPEHLPILPKCYQRCFTVNHSLARQIPCVQTITRKMWKQVRRETSGQERDSSLHIEELEVRLEHYVREI